MRSLLVFCRLRWISILLSFLFMWGPLNARACDTFDGTYLTIPYVVAGNTLYATVVISVKITDVRAVSGVVGTPPATITADYYDPASGLLTIPCVTVGQTTYTNVIVVVNVINVKSVAGAYPNTNAPTLILNNPLPDATVGEAYSQKLVFSVLPASSYTYGIDTLANGVTPTGMTVNMTGILSGTPFATGAADINGNQVSKTYTFGVCATDTLSRTTTSPCPQTSITVNPAYSLTGTWSGSWSWAGPASNGCPANDGGAFSMTLTQSGSSFSGSVDSAGIQLLDSSTCAVTDTVSYSGSASGTLSGTTVNLSYTLSGIELTFTGTATLHAKTLTSSSLVRVTGGSGSLSLTKQ